ncbi:MAG: DNA polymerase [Candidatus Competibacter sp.]|nr:DNA polymerase [Candidatus Competibacter sp.]
MDEVRGPLLAKYAPADIVSIIPDWHTLAVSRAEVEAMHGATVAGVPVAAVLDQAALWDMYDLRDPGVLEAFAKSLQEPGQPLAALPAAKGQAGLFEEPNRTDTAASLLRREGFEVVYVIDPAAAQAEVRRLLAAPGVLGLDIETAKTPAYRDHPGAGLDPHLSRIRLVQLATAGFVAVFDLDRIPLALLAPLWTRPLVAHNAGFELKHLLHAGADPARLHCSLLLDRVLSGRRRSLADVAADRLGWMLDKTLQVSDWNAAELSQAQIAYAALDAAAAFRLYPALLVAIQTGGRLPAYTLLLRAQRPVAKMELAGCPFDLQGHAVLCDQWERERLAAIEPLAAVLGPGISPDSAAQLATWLAQTLPPERLAIWQKTAGGQPATGADVLAMADDLEVVKPLLAYKTAAKRLSTYGPAFAKWVSPATGRIHASFSIAHSRPGRFSCSSPNLQQLPRDPTFRRLVKADPGRRLVVADYSQVELRVMALLCQDPAMLAAYRDGQDLHRLTAAAVLGIEPAAVTKAQRQLAKAVNFGLIYGMAPKTLVSHAKANYGVVMSLAEAEAAHAAFFAAYPRLRLWHRTTAAHTEQTGKATIRGGLVRDFIQEPGGVKYTESLNTPVQGAAAAALLAALPLLDQALAGIDAQPINLIHDEWVLDVAAADIEPAKAALVDTMTAGFAAIFPEAEAAGTLRDLAEAREGDNWESAKG